jgi:hypothetical protein
VAVFPKLIYRVNAVLIQIPPVFSEEVDKVILRFVCKCERPRIAKPTKQKQ